MLDFLARSSGRSIGIIGLRIRRLEQARRRGAKNWSAYRQAAADARPSIAQQCPNLVSFSKGCGYNNPQSVSCETYRLLSGLYKHEESRVDPVDPFFDSGAWMREYAALQGPRSEETTKGSTMVLNGGWRI
ncbi:hypothetical protein [Bradyrhizobium ottawaense]|uniref:hypothetical protein n=1 Tax=Bradyrhizobium ottawaense TaxID=931866 RepID=UPI003513A6F8